MRTKKPRVVSLDEVRITRDGEYAHIEYADESVGGMALKLGREVTSISDDEIMEHHNDVVRAMETMAAEYEHVAVEVPVGRPQIRYFELGHQWTPRGGVLRCVIDDGEVRNEPTIWIDDRELTWREFGGLLETYAGWGMRLVFVPDDELQVEPVIDVREPEDPIEPKAPWDLDTPGRSEVHQAAVVEPGGSAPARPVRPSRSSADAKRDPLLERKPIYLLRVQLDDTDPPVWRLLLVSGNRSLKKLHKIFQIAMGWTDSHLHLFTTGDGQPAVTDPRFGLDDDIRDEARVKLRSFAPEVRSRFRYEYDFGDSWIHDVVVEAIVSPDGVGRTPRCDGGERAFPPEDCGGIPGYYDLLAAMCDPAHPEREEYVRWLGREFAPDIIDIDAINRDLRRLK